MTNIYLYGKLGKVFGYKHSYAIRKPIDAIKALMANKKNFKKIFRTWPKEGKFYEIICDGKIIQNENELLNSRKIENIHICPVIVGAGGRNKLGVLQIVLGVILIATGIGLAALASGGGLAGGLAAIKAGTAGFAGIAFNIGVGFVVGGVMSLLFPPPVPSFQQDVQSKSYLFSSLENSTVQGAPVPVGYGRMRIGSKIIETSLEPVNLSNGSTTDLLSSPEYAAYRDVRYFSDMRKMRYNPKFKRQ